MPTRPSSAWPGFSFIVPGLNYTLSRLCSRAVQDHRFAMKVRPSDYDSCPASFSQGLLSPICAGLR